MKTVERGEIIRINLDPTEGREQAGNARPCLVLSNTKFNQYRRGIVVVTPLTKTIKPQIKTMIPIPSGFKATGSVIAEQVRTIDQRSGKPRRFTAGNLTSKKDGGRVQEKSYRQIL